MAGLTPALRSFNEVDSEEPFTEENFLAKGDLSEGVSGRRSIDSSYEEHFDNVVLNPRSGNGHLENDMD